MVLREVLEVAVKLGDFLLVRLAGNLFEPLLLLRSRKGKTHKRSGQEEEEVRHRRNAHKAGSGRRIKAQKAGSGRRRKAQDGGLVRRMARREEGQKTKKRHRMPGWDAGSEGDQDVRAFA